MIENDRQYWHVTITAPGQPDYLMPKGWEERWHDDSDLWHAYEVYAYGNGPNNPPTCVFRRVMKTDERSNGDIARVWELSAL
jgi:hypothetical protein